MTYRVYLCHFRNKAIHIVCVPLLLWSALIFCALYGPIQYWSVFPVDPEGLIITAVYGITYVAFHAALGVYVVVWARASFR